MIHKEALCINCGCCVSECNSMESDPEFFGPAALAKGMRFVGDARDHATVERLEAYNAEHGIWDCTRCYFCQERCPKGVDPRDAIAKLGAESIKHGIDRDMGAKHAKWFVNSAKTTGWLRETELVPEDAGHRLVDQADEVRDGPGEEGQGAAAVPAARRREREGVARALQPRQGAGPRRRRRDRPGRDGLARIEFAEHGEHAPEPETRAEGGGLSHARVAYYKGCLASLSAKELDTSTQALAPKLGLELVELESVTCCGAGDIHEAEPDYYLHLNARILAYGEATGADTLMTICNVCTLNLRQANWQLKNDDAAARPREREPRARRRPAVLGRRRGQALALADRRGRGLRAAEAGRAQGAEGAQDRAVLRLPDPAAVEDPRLRGPGPAVVARADHRGLRRRADRLPGEDQVLRLPDHPGARGDRARRADPADRAGDGGRRGRDGHAVPALPPLARRVAAEARGVDGQDVRPADPPPLAARRRRRRARGVGAEVQAARRLRSRRSSRSSRSEAGPSARASPRVAGVAAGGIAGAVRGRLGAARASSTSPCPGCRRSSTGCGSRTSPTSISACPRAARARSTGRSSGSPSGSPTSSSSPATCSPGRRASERLRALLARLPPATPCSATTTSPTRRDPFSKPVGERRPRRRDAARRRGGDARAARPARAARRRRPALVHARAGRGRGSSPTRRPTCASCSATSRASSTGCPPGAFHLVLAGHMHDGQICLPYAGRQGAHRPPAGAVQPRASTGGRRRAARLARARHDVRPVPLLRPSGGDRARPAIGVIPAPASAKPAPRRRLRSLVGTRVAGLTGATSDRTGGLPRLHLVAVADAPRRQAPLDPEGRGGVGRLGDGLLRRRRQAARLDAVRAVGALPARGGAAGGAALAGGGARHLRLRRRRGDAVGDAVALPRGDRRRAGPGREGARGVRVPLPRGRVAYERFLVHRTVFPSDFLADFGFRTCGRGAGRARPARARRARPGGRGHARTGVPGAEGGAHAGAGAAAAMIEEIVDFDRYRSAGALVESAGASSGARARSGSTGSSGRRRSTRMVEDATAARRARLPERRGAQRVLRRRGRRVAAGGPPAPDPRPLGAEGGRDGPAPG